MHVLMQHSFPFGSEKDEAYTMNMTALLAMAGLSCSYVVFLMYCSYVTSQFW